MSSLTDQINALTVRVNNLQSLLLGARDPGLFYAVMGSYVIFGGMVTEGYSATDMILALDGANASDTIHLNPDRNVTPVRYEQYSNIAIVYGEVLLLADKNLSILQDSALTVTTAPATGYHRYDIVYCYVSAAGPAVAIAAGTAVLNASTPSDPTLPQGVLSLARVHVEAAVTGIANAKITDLRNFTGRLRAPIGYIENTAATYTVLASDINITMNRAGTVTITLPTASTSLGRELWLRTIQAQTVVSATSNVVPLVGGAAATGILAATAGKWAKLVSDGVDWETVASN